MTTAQSAPSQNEIFNQRLPFVIAGMLIVSAMLVLKMISFQELSPEVINELNPNYNQVVNLASARGIIYDRSGQQLAANTLEYRIGISPNLVSNPQRDATELASILGLDELKLYQDLSSDQSYVLLAPSVSADIGQQIEDLKKNEPLPALQIDQIPRRVYPQGTLAAQILGFVSGDLKGYYGVEGEFEDQLVGRTRSEVVSDIPFDVSSQQEPDTGSDIYLTIDRDIQYLIENELSLAIDQTGSKNGTIIVMNPRTGDILGMASYPSFDPNDYANVQNNADWNNPAISQQYEPGSVMKLLTISSALDSGAITPDWTYNDQGRLDQAGITVWDWDRQAHGLVDTTGILVNSLNVGAATVSMKMGPTDFYTYMSKFGIGRLTGINLQGEAAGKLKVPGDSDWSESDLLANSYGQGVAVTPLQMITSVAAIANDGLMMQPNIVQKIVKGSNVSYSQPIALGRPISENTAHTVRDMMVATINNGVDNKAALPGYNIAGKTGTAEIPIPTGYRDDAWIMTFIGFLPADDPQVIVLIKLDQPTSGRWSSDVAAPVFQHLVQRLVVLMEIPPDDVRHALISQGGSVDDVKR